MEIDRIIAILQNELDSHDCSDMGVVQLTPALVDGFISELIAIRYDIVTLIKLEDMVESRLVDEARERAYADLKNRHPEDYQ